MAGSKKKPAERKPRVICDDCDGQGYTWSERSLLKWEHQTPWFDRVKMSPKPPESWRDLNCVRCQGAGYLDLKTGLPLLGRLIDSAQRKCLRETNGSTDPRKGLKNTLPGGRRNSGNRTKRPQTA